MIDLNNEWLTRLDALKEQHTHELQQMQQVHEETVEGVRKSHTAILDEMQKEMQVANKVFIMEKERLQKAIDDSDSELALKNRHLQQQLHDLAHQQDKKQMIIYEQNHTLSLEKETVNELQQCVQMKEREIANLRERYDLLLERNEHMRSDQENYLQ